jgi:hypothetical protein
MKLQICFNSLEKFGAIDELDGRRTTSIRVERHAPAERRSRRLDRIIVVRPVRPRNAYRQRNQADLARGDAGRAA